MMEELDVCIVGAGVAGLSAAIALRRVDPRLHIKVLDSRSMPSSKYGGFVSLQPNGRKAASAISPALAASLERNALLEKRTLLHGEDGRLITRLDMHHELAQHELAPSEDIVQASDVGPSRHGAAKCWRELNACTQDTMVIGWWELEKILVGMLPQHTVEYEISFLKYSETEGGVIALFEGLAYPIRCRALLGCDGPFSNVRAQCVQDSEPAYDRTVKFNGRLDGHHVSTTPLDFCSWWIRKGQVFISHPLANGDVGWEAIVCERELQAAGFTFDESLARVLQEGVDAHSLKEEDAQPAQTLAALFKGYPKAVDQMIKYAVPNAILESGVFIRSPAEMPPSMGKGRVAILGEAAHPMRPTGQDANMAMEDAAELAAFVQEYGLCKEALRRYDVARRPRWRFAMQLTMAQGASTTTGVAISRGFLDYTQDLYARDFQPIGRCARPEPKGLKGFLAGFVQAVFATGLVTVLALAGGGLWPEAEVAMSEDEPSQARDEASIAGRGKRLVARGGRRVKGALKSICRRLAGTTPLKAATKQYDAAKEYAEKRAEGITDTTIDYGSQYAKSTVNRRIARFFGVF